MTRHGSVTSTQPRWASGMSNRLGCRPVARYVCSTKSLTRWTNSGVRDMCAFRVGATSLATVARPPRGGVPRGWARGLGREPDEAGLGGGLLPPDIALLGG